MALKSFPSLQLVVKLSQRRPWYPSTILWDHSSSFSLAVMSSDWPFTWMSEIWSQKTKKKESGVRGQKIFKDTIILSKTRNYFCSKSLVEKVKLKNKSSWKPGCKWVWFSWTFGRRKKKKKEFHSALECFPDVKWGTIKDGNEMKPISFLQRAKGNSPKPRIWTENDQSCRELAARTQLIKVSHWSYKVLSKSL